MVLHLKNTYTTQTHKDTNDIASSFLSPENGGGSRDRHVQ